MEDKKPLLARALIGILIVNTFWGMILLCDFRWYSFIFSYLSETQLPVRYFLSWAGRILLVTAGLGTFFYKETFRKGLIILLSINILTIYFKHPVEAVANSYTYHGVDIEKYTGMLTQAGIEGIDFIKISSWVLSAWDCLFALVFIIYFSRQKIRRHFT